MFFKKTNLNYKNLNFQNVFEENKKGTVYILNLIKVKIQRDIPLLRMTVTWLGQPGKLNENLFF